MIRNKNSVAKAVIAIALLALFFVLVRSHLGIEMDDDFVYMDDGRHMGIVAFFRAHDWGPLYSLWFRLLGVFLHSPIRQYFASWAILVTAIALTPTAFQRRAAWLFTLIVLCLPIVTDGPYIGLFASAIILPVFCFLLSKHLSFVEAAFACGVLSFFLTFSRPEYNAGVLLCAFVTVAAAWWSRRRQRRGGMATVAAFGLPPWLMVMIVVGLSAVTVTLVKVAPSHRSGMAFAQHFNVRSALASRIPNGPDVWRSNYAELRFGVDTTKNSLTGTATIGTFLRANPRLFAWELIENLKDPRTYWLLLFVLAVLAIPWLRRGLDQLRPHSLFLLLVCIPPLAGTVIIFPHVHYMAVVLPGVLVFALEMLDPERWMPPVALPLLLAAGVALMVWIVAVQPGNTNGWIPLKRVDLFRVDCLRRWDAASPPASPHVFSVVDVTRPFLVNPAREFSYPRDFSSWGQFQQWVRQDSPAWISVDAPASAQYGSPSVNSRLGVDGKTLDAFLQEDVGYTAHACGGIAQMTVYVQKPR